MLQFLCACRRGKVSTAGTSGCRDDLHSTGEINSFEKPVILTAPPPCNFVIDILLCLVKLILVLVTKA